MDNELTDHVQGNVWLAGEEFFLVAIATGKGAGLCSRISSGFNVGVGISHHQEIFWWDSGLSKCSLSLVDLLHGQKQALWVRLYVARLLWADNGNKVLANVHLP